VQRREALVRCDGRDCPAGQELRNHIGVATRGGQVQRGAAVMVDGVDDLAGPGVLEEQLRN